MTPRDIEDPPEEHSLGKGVVESAGDEGFEHVGDALARALDKISRGISPTLPEIEAAAMSEIAKIMGWPLDPPAWESAAAPPEEAEPAAPQEAASPADLQRRLDAIAEFTPPTDPEALELYTIAAEVGPKAARQRILDALSRGGMSRNRANTLLFALGLGRV